MMRISAAKAKKRKHVRMNSWATMMNSGITDAKVRQRYTSGGYRCPGSNKK
jgi:hypothetical protein